MATISIPVNAGKVTSRDQSLFAEGELYYAQDCEYRPNNPALWKVNGRTEINSTPESGSIKGATYCEFDGSADKLVVHVGTTYRISNAVVSDASFSNLVTGLTGGSTLTTAYLANKHYLFNGVDKGRELASDGTTVTVGMTTLTEPRYFGMKGSGSIVLSSGSTLSYWIEERVKDASGNVIKRSASTSDAVYTWTGTSTTPNTVELQLGGGNYVPINSDATHIALFRTATNSSFPIGAQITEVEIASGSPIFDSTSATDPGFPDGEIYELLSAEIYGVVINTPRNGSPPTASLAEVYEDSLVLNDISDRSKIWYSWPFAPHSFPLQNWIDFPRSDEVNNIKALGGMLIILLRDSVWRIHALPRPEDSSFDRTLKEEIEGAHGCVGPYAACTYGYGDGNRLAYVSRYGLMVTNGSQWDVLSSDLDWESTFNISQLSKAVLINNPAKFRLELYGPSYGSTVNDVCYFFHYHPSHIKSDGPSFRSKVTGPIHRPATCATVANISNEKYVITGYSDGKLYLGDSGNVEPIGSIEMVVRTGDLGLGGPGSSTKVIRMWCHHQAHVDQRAFLVHVSRNEGEDDITRKQIIDLDRRENTQMDWPGEAEAFQLGFENTDSDGTVCLDYFQAEVIPMGGAG